MTARYVLAIDPSGSFQEGKGQTGWVLFDNETKKICKFGVIKALNYQNQFRFWDAHIELIDGLTGFHPDIVMEDYLLYADRSRQQINSRLETPQLIGIIKYEAYKRGIYVTTQTAQMVKTRWSDGILEHKGYITKTNVGYCIKETRVVDHIRDALRHALHFSTYTSNYGKEFLNEQRRKREAKADDYYSY